MFLTSRGKPWPIRLYFTLGYIVTVMCPHVSRDRWCPATCLRAPLPTMPRSNHVCVCVYISGLRFISLFACDSSHPAELTARGVNKLCGLNTHKCIQRHTKSVFLQHKASISRKDTEMHKHTQESQIGRTFNSKWTSAPLLWIQWECVWVIESCAELHTLQWHHWVPR